MLRSLLRVSRVCACAENDYEASAFTSSHIQLLQLLCSQAALSIDNARLYAALSVYNASLEQQVHVRTCELEQKNAQLSLAKEAAERATRAKADFLSNMSHEIRTPMNAVLGVGRLLADTPLSLDQQQLVAMIANSGQLLLTIINDILDYSKIEAGRLTLNFASHNVSEVLESAALLCYDMAASKGLELSWFADPSLPPALLLDATRLQQIMLNLLSNAIKVKVCGCWPVPFAQPARWDLWLPELPADAKLPAADVALAVCAIQFTRIGVVEVELCGHALPAEPDADPDEQPRVELTCRVKVSARWPRPPSEHCRNGRRALEAEQPAVVTRACV